MKTSSASRDRRLGRREQLGDVARSCEAAQAGFVLEPRLELVDRNPVSEEMEQRTRVDAARPCPHRDAVERGEAHRRVDRASVEDRSDGATAAEVADDEAPHPNLLCRPGDRQAVEAEAPDAQRAPPLGQGVGRRPLRQRSMELGVEHRDVGEVRKQRAPRERVERRLHVKRRELDQFAQLIRHGVVDECRLDEAFTAVNDPVRDSPTRAAASSSDATGFERSSRRQRSA